MTTNSAPQAPVPAADEIHGDTVTAIELHDVHRSFGEVRVVDGLDLTIHPGEIVALLSPNGAGKTSTIDMVLGLSRPDTGTVSVFGLDPHQAIARGLRPCSRPADCSRT